MISLRQISIDKYSIVSSRSGFAHKVDLEPWMLLILLEQLGVQVLSLVLNKVIINITSLKSKTDYLYMSRKVTVPKEWISYNRNHKNLGFQPHQKINCAIYINWCCEVSQEKSSTGCPVKSDKFIISLIFHRLTLNKFFQIFMTLNNYPTLT